MKQKDNNVAATVLARIVKRRVAAFVLDVNVRFLLNEKFGAVLVPKPTRAVKSSLAGEVNLVNVDFGGEKKLDNV